MPDIPSRSLSMYGKYVSREKSLKGDIVLDNNIIECELHPKEKGNYEIIITDRNAVKGRAWCACIRFSFACQWFPDRMDQNSPYSFEKPIRKIDSMNVIIQPEDGLCGQACVWQC